MPTLAADYGRISRALPVSVRLELRQSWASHTRVSPGSRANTPSIARNLTKLCQRIAWLLVVNLLAFRYTKRVGAPEFIAPPEKVQPVRLHGISPMPQQTPFTESPMQAAGRMWRENKVNWLVGIALIVTSLASIVGYFDLIPEVSTNARAPAATFFPSGYTLTVKIRNCPSDQGHVMVMLYDGVTFNENSTALRVGSVPISGGQAEWVVHNLPLGKYSVVAFHDLNANEAFNPESERQGYSMDKVSDSNAEPPSSDFSLKDTVFDFTTDLPSVTINLRP